MKVKKLLRLALVLCVLTALCLPLAVSAEGFGDGEGRALAKTKITAIGWAKGTGVSLTWNKVSGADSYEIYRSEKKAKGYKLVGTSAANTWKDSGARAKKAYYYYIVGTGAAGRGAKGTVSGVYTVDGPKFASAKKQSDGSMLLKWKKNSKAEGYVIYRAQAGSNSYKKVGTTKKGVVTFTDKKAKIGILYNYAVAGVFKAKDGKTVESPMGAPRLVQQGPAKVSGVAASVNQSAGSVTVSWKKAANATGYDVYANGSKIGTTKKTSVTLDLGGRKGNISITVKSLGTWKGKKNKAGQASDAVSVIALGTPGLGVSLGEKNGTSGAVKATWGAVSCATTYRVEYTIGGTAKTYTTDALSMSQQAPRQTFVKVRAQAGYTKADGSVEWGPWSSARQIYAFWGKFYALTIGNNAYPGDSALKGPRNDASGMTAMLKAASKTPYTVRSVYDVSDTSDFVSQIRSAFSAATADDICLFYYSGHGSEDGSIIGTALNYYSFMEPAELKAELDRYGAGCPKIVILDSCFSGQAIHKGYSRGSVTVDSKGAAESFNAAVIRAFSSGAKSGEMATSGYYVLTAASWYEESWEYGSNGVNFGGFTCGLLEGSGYNEIKRAVVGKLAADTNNDKYITLNEGYVYARNFVNQLPQPQTVAVYPSNSSFVLWGR